MSVVAGRCWGMRTPCPATIECRRDAQLLWAHLFERRVTFRLEEDPAEWLDVRGEAALSPREVARFRTLVAEVDRLGAVAFDCYDDVERLREVTLLMDGRNDALQSAA